MLEPEQNMLLPSQGVSTDLAVSWEQARHLADDNLQDVAVVREPVEHEERQRDVEHLYRCLLPPKVHLLSAAS